MGIFLPDDIAALFRQYNITNYGELKLAAEARLDEELVRIYWYITLEVIPYMSQLS